MKWGSLASNAIMLAQCRNGLLQGGSQTSHQPSYQVWEWEDVCVCLQVCVHVPTRPRVRARMRAHMLYV